MQRNEIGLNLYTVFGIVTEPMFRQQCTQRFITTELRNFKNIFECVIFVGFGQSLATSKLAIRNVSRGIF